MYGFSSTSFTTHKLISLDMTAKKEKKREKSEVLKQKMSVS